MVDIRFIFGGGWLMVHLAHLLEPYIHYPKGPGGDTGLPGGVPK